VQRNAPKVCTGFVRFGIAAGIVLCSNDLHFAPIASNWRRACAHWSLASFAPCYRR
jgi:hypothetical protein